MKKERILSTWSVYRLHCLPTLTHLSGYPKDSLRDEQTQYWIVLRLGTKECTTWNGWAGTWVKAIES